jgi:predicted DCC family thiol-disulfide oxidoreductase YuxK
MHLRRADGTIVSGAAAFAEIWRGMPGLRWLGQLLGVAPFGAIAEFGYRIFLSARKLWR